jgi:hypothetical protein
MCDVAKRRGGQGGRCPFSAPHGSGDGQSSILAGLKRRCAVKVGHLHPRPLVGHNDQPGDGNGRINSISNLMFADNNRMLM